MSSSNRKTNFSSQRTAIPFGKFESGSDDVFPCNESMVGREGARAKLIDFLTNAGTRKAILITGRRGMGKTSFVNYCLKEYEEARIERYWRSDIGRTLSAWVWLYAISMLCASAFVLGNSILIILLDNIINRDNYFLWIPLILLVFCLSYPLLHAFKIFTVLFKKKLDISGNIFRYLSVLIIIFIIWFMPDSRSPIITLSRLLVMITTVYFTGELLDQNLITLDTLLRPIISLLRLDFIGKKSYWKKYKNKRLGWVIFSLFSAIACYLTFYFDSIDYQKTSVGKNTFSNFFIASELFGLAAINRFIGLLKKPPHLKKLQIYSALWKSKVWFFFIGIVFLFSPPFLFLFTEKEFNLSSGWVYLLSSCLILTFIRFFHLIRKIKLHKEQTPKPEFGMRHLYSSSLLALKAIFFILLSLYALHPLNTLLDNSKEKHCDSQKSSLGITNLFNENGAYFALKDRPYCNVTDFSKTNNNDENLDVNYLSNYLPLLFNSKDELKYILLIVLVTALIFWIEYEWIIRPGQFWRRDTSMGGTNRPGYYDDFDDKKEVEFSPITIPGDDSKRKEARIEIQKFIKNQVINYRERRRLFEELTFLNYFKHLHLTTLTSTINLGFEELDHRSVIHAMLLDIREQYYQKFVSLRSSRVVIRSGFSVFLAMLLVTELSNNHFNTDNRNQISKIKNNKNTEQKPKYIAQVSKFKLNNSLQKEQKIIIMEAEEKNLILGNKYCQKTRSGSQSEAEKNKAKGMYENLPKVPKLLCELGGFYAATILPFLYFELLPIHLHKDNVQTLSKTLSWSFDIRTSYFLGITNGSSNTKNNKQMSFCIYHLLFFTLIFYLFRRINRILKVSPYSINLEKIDELLHALTSTTKTKSSRDFPIFVRFASALSGSFQENEKRIERAQLDPRLVELQFMGVLEKICHSRPIYFNSLRSTKKSPTIEVTFVFDELDKLATDMTSKQHSGNVDSNDSELQRLNLMKGLLSNMKRIITSSEARYIFLGGRLLHDDWLADGARRQSLLTSIFSDEIYLPSLLTDASITWFNTEPEEKKTGAKPTKFPGTHSLHSRIEEYFVWQYYLARMRFEHWATRIWAPIIGIPEWDERPRGFIQVSYKRLKNLMNKAVTNRSAQSYEISPLQTLAIRNTHNGKHLNDTNKDSSFEHGRLSAFIQFLAYRSAGNPKHLNEVMASFIMSADRAIDNETGRDEGFNCQDVLYFPDHKVMRIQLIARVYRQLCKGFEEKIRGRDDKTIVALIYLSDFLFKFHDRAFSWESLELIDELVHMHRGHDLRMLLHELVEHYTDRYLHRIINGMYTYRFRGYFANEIEYLSRNSEEEMAAFNFTLDESQMLRSHLENILDSEDNRNKTDILGMLGELHEFYQEFEMARQYYRRCVTARLPMIKEHIGDKIGNGTDEMSVIQAIYTNKFEGREALLALQQWGPMTLRWFLQIVMTYERENNFNSALIRYERYITFAECMIQAFALEEPKRFNPKSYHVSKEKTPTDHTYVLEYLGLLFEPLFAYAWLLEKNSYTSGNSHFVLDEGIKKYEKILNNNVVKPEFMGFVKAQWNKKIGALCFYKGLAITQEKSKKLAYVTRARDYYSKSAIQLSLYFRKGVGTEYKKNEANTLNKAFLNNQYPTDYCFSVAECLGDLSESILGEIDPIKLFNLSKTNDLNSKQDKNNYEKTTIYLVQQLDEYFFHSDRNEKEICILNWLAKSNYYGQHNFSTLNLTQQFDLSLNLALASSFYMLRAGYTESAARGAMHTAEVVAQYLNWYWFNIVIKGIDRKQHWQGFPIISIVMKKIIWYTGYLQKLFRSVRSNINLNSNVAPKEEPDPYLIGELIPSSALTSLCSIGISLSFFLRSKNNPNSKSVNELKLYMDNLRVVIKKWTGNDPPQRDKYFYLYEYFEKKLIYSIQRHRYPVLNQLNILKTLVDGSLIHGYLSEDNTNTQNTCAWLQELYYINQKYNHPLHFTPMQFGFSLFLSWHINNLKNKYGKKIVNLHLDEITDFDLHTEFHHSLIQSLDMCHMGRGYYKAINDMYYLYDDFNDNQIHRNHAMQMAGAELTKTALSMEKNQEKILYLTHKK